MHIPEWTGVCPASVIFPFELSSRRKSVFFELRDFFYQPVILTPPQPMAERSHVLLISISFVYPIGIESVLVHR
jgi:hypothetical protein